jgi:hypothetical protein
MKKQLLSEELLRMKRLAGLISEGVDVSAKDVSGSLLNEELESDENISLPSWIEGEELDGGEVLLYVKPEWFNKYQQVLEKNIKEYYMLLSKSKGIFLKTMPGYNPQEDYITDDGTTFIDGKPAGVNSGDKLENRQNFGNKWWEDIVNNKRFIDLLEDKAFVVGVISEEEIKNIKEYLKKKYNKSNFIDILLLKTPFKG